MLDRRAFDAQRIHSHRILPTTSLHRVGARQPATQRRPSKKAGRRITRSELCFTGKADSLEEEQGHYSLQTNLRCLFRCVGPTNYKESSLTVDLRRRRKSRPEGYSRVVGGFSAMTNKPFGHCDSHPSDFMYEEQLPALHLKFSLMLRRHTRGVPPGREASP